MNITIPILIFASITGFLILYELIIFFQVFRREKKKTGPQPVSIVICAHNRLKELEAFVMAVIEQKHPDFEVILVNDRSEDGTYDFLFELKQKYSHVKMVTIEETPDHISGKKFAITLGVKAATKPYVLLTDTDCYPASENWAAEMSTGF